MFKPFRVVCLLLGFASAAFACGDSASETPVIPTIGTVATVQGRVAAAGSSYPLSGVIVSIGGVRLLTKADGTYAVSGLRPGDALLTAERQGYMKYSQYVVLEGARTFNIFLTPQSP